MQTIINVEASLAVIDYMVLHGVAQNRLHVIPKGKTCPSNTNGIWSLFMSRQTNLRRGRSSGSRLTWWNLAFTSPLMATLCSRNCNSTPRCEGPKVGPGNSHSFRFRPRYWKEQLNTMQLLLWVTMWCGIYHDSTDCVTSLEFSFLSF